MVICEKEVRSLLHDPGEMLIRLVNPVLWLAVFGAALSYKVTIGRTPAEYQQFILPGILIHTVLITGAVYGISLKWESETGALGKLLAAPIPRTSVVLGKALAAVVRAFIQMGVLLLTARILGIGYSLNPLAILLSAGMVLVFVLGFASLYIIVAMISGTVRAYTGLTGLLQMPFFFASNSLYTLDGAPYWLRVVAGLNPVTYAVDFVRQIMIYNNWDVLLLLRDFAFVSVCTFAGIAVATMLFRRKVT